MFAFNVIIAFVKETEKTPLLHTHHSKFHPYLEALTYLTKEYSTVMLPPEYLVKPS